MTRAGAREAVIVDCGRSAFGKRKGALAGWHPTDLLGLVLSELVSRNDIDPAQARSMLAATHWNRTSRHGSEHGVTDVRL